jgi:putative membrane protein
MKKPLSLIKHLAAVAVTGGLVCFAGSAYGQNTASESNAEPTKTDATAATNQQPRKSTKASKTTDQNAGAASTTTATTGSAATTGATGSAQISGPDRQFLMMAAKDGMKEVHMGQMAAQQGQSAEVKKMGGQIASDHTKANQQLMAIAASKGVKVDTRHKMDKMSKKEMANFDQAWLAMMVNDHQKDIAAYQRQAQQGTDPELKAFAKKTLPVLQKHLKMVQAAQKKMGTGATAPNTTGTTDTTGSTTAKTGR